MRNDVMSTDMLKERLVALKTTKEFFTDKEQEMIKGEIKYIEYIIYSNESNMFNER